MARGRSASPARKAADGRRASSVRQRATVATHGAPTVREPTLLLKPTSSAGADTAVPRVPAAPAPLKKAASPPSPKSSCCCSCLKAVAIVVGVVVLAVLALVAVLRLDLSAPLEELVSDVLGDAKRPPPVPGMVLVIDLGSNGTAYATVTRKQGSKVTVDTTRRLEVFRPDRPGETRDKAPSMFLLGDGRAGAAKHALLPSLPTLAAYGTLAVEEFADSTGEDGQAFFLHLAAMLDRVVAPDGKRRNVTGLSIAAYPAGSLAPPPKGTASQAPARVRAVDLLALLTFSMEDKLEKDMAKKLHGPVTIAADGTTGPPLPVNRVVYVSPPSWGPEEHAAVRAHLEGVKAQDASRAWSVHFVSPLTAGLTNALFSDAWSKAVKVRQGMKLLVVDAGAAAARLALVSLESVHPVQVKVLSRETVREGGGQRVNDAFTDLLGACLPEGEFSSLRGADLVDLARTFERYKRSYSVVDPKPYPIVVPLAELLARLRPTKQGQDDVLDRIAKRMSGKEQGGGFLSKLASSAASWMGLSKDDVLLEKEQRRLRLKSGFVRDRLFGSAVGAVVNATQDMLRRAGGAEAVVLVGGFANADALTQAMEEGLKGMVRAATAQRGGQQAVIPLVVATEPELALVRGAALFALEPRAFVQDDANAKQRRKEGEEKKRKEKEQEEQKRGEKEQKKGQ